MVRKKFRAKLSSGFTVRLCKAWPAVSQLSTHLQSKGLGLIQLRHWKGMSFAERSCGFTAGHHQLNYSNNLLVTNSKTLLIWDKRRESTGKAAPACLSKESSKQDPRTAGTTELRSSL